MAYHFSHRSRGVWAATLLLVGSMFACGGHIRRSFHDVDALPAQDEVPFLRLHSHDGHLWTLDTWTVDAEAGVVTGHGEYLDDNRMLVSGGYFSIPFDEIALGETNTQVDDVGSGVAMLMVATVASGVVTAVCLTDPKACFGSCPTFYVEDDPTIRSEGFSDAVARSLEYADTDDLHVRHPGGPLALTMTNEALETHVVRSVELVAAPRPVGGTTTRRADGAFVQVTSELEPHACQAEGGDCLDDVRARDGRAYVSEASTTDLAERETIQLRFDSPVGEELALRVSARNSLVNTFIFYEAVASLGPDYASLYALLDRDTLLARQLQEGLDRIQGPIGVEVRVDDEWVSAGGFREIGPIAVETQSIPLAGVTPGQPIDIRLTATRGGWRIDQVALVSLGAVVEPTVLSPRAVDGPSDDALERLTNLDEVLITYPGQTYVLDFELPEGDWDLHLRSRGYYYEWMREGWLSRADPPTAWRALTDPMWFARHLAPAYAERGPELETLFWQSRVHGGAP